MNLMKLPVERVYLDDTVGITLGYVIIHCEQEMFARGKNTFLL